MKNFCYALSLLLLVIPFHLAGREECTVAVVSGKATADGRPLLWKNRDTSTLDNEIAYFNDGEYPYVGVINAGDRTQVWMGVNTEGFAIMNAESLDLEGTMLDDEGFFMKQALMECANVDDFEDLLVKTNKTGRGTKANFGVIDAQGAAAMFEAGNHTFTKFNANDPEAAPMGYFVRANFSKTGTGKPGYGHIRYNRADTLFTKFIAENDLTHKTLLRYIARDLINDRTDPYPLPFEGREGKNPKGFIKTHDSINRHRTASVSVFHGVLPDEAPELTTMWTILGEPVCGAAIPVWASAGSVPPALDGDPTSELNGLIQRIEKKAYSKASLLKYINTAVLKNKKDNGLLDILFPLEDEIFLLTHQHLSQWRQTLPGPDVVLEFETRMINIVIEKLDPDN
ncbi:carcinine hydrolase/isopenicillin-N N-acyltransferase family protein [Elusimicrobiota bacterium]